MKSNKISYGELAILFVEEYKKGKISISSKDWIYLAKKNGFPDTMAEKGCPKNTFLGLCEDGFVKGIPCGNYTSSTKNKGYALEALEILKRRPELSNNPRELWEEIADISYNQQMSVVCALWKANLIKNS